MTNLPQQLLNSLSQLNHFNKEAFVNAHDQKHKITSIRLNPFKKVELDFELNDAVNWNENGFYLDERPSFTNDPLFNAGCYYVQEAGSMFIEFALKQQLDLSTPLNILDACAAPGGKSTLINSLLNNQSLLVANEFVKSRAEVLAYNLSKWGNCNSIVTNNNTEKFSHLSSFFDAIVIDAPCSGSGLFRKQPEAIDQWSEANVEMCFERQKMILTDVIPALKENGILIYSTCSYSIQENEQVVQWLINEFNLEYLTLPINKNWGIIETSHGYRFYPHLTKSEGFFCAVLRKKNDKSSSFSTKKKITKIDISSQEKTILNQFVDLSELKVIKKNDQFHLLNEAAFDFLTLYEKHFYLRKAGIVVGEIKGKDLVPNQELAISNLINQGVVRLDLDLENAVKFLKKESFNNKSNLLGLVLITYKNIGLGWAKILNNRINNYLPNNLRILN